MKQSELIAEIEGLIEETMRTSESQSVSTPWLVQTVVSRHSKIEGNDLPFAVLCAYEHVRDSVRSAQRQYRPHPDDGQDDLPGTRIQKRYVIQRDGEDFIVATEKLTAAELRLKATEVRRMGAGCYEHARELDRLADDRETLV